MSDGRRFVKQMHQMSQTASNEVVDIIIGEVTSVAPLKVKLDKIELTETFLIVGPYCKEAKITIPAHSHSYTDDGSGRTTGTALTEIILWRNLVVGDQVMMLKCGKGQKYYMLQRKDGIYL